MVQSESVSDSSPLKRTRSSAVNAEMLIRLNSMDESDENNTLAALDGVDSNMGMTGPGQAVDISNDDGFQEDARVLKRKRRLNKQKNAAASSTSCVPASIKHKSTSTPPSPAVPSSSTRVVNSAVSSPSRRAMNGNAVRPSPAVPAAQPSRSVPSPSKGRAVSSAPSPCLSSSNQSEQTGVPMSPTPPVSNAVSKQDKCPYGSSGDLTSSIAVDTPESSVDKQAFELTRQLKGLREALTLSKNRAGDQPMPSDKVIIEALEKEIAQLKSKIPPEGHLHEKLQPTDHQCFFHCLEDATGVSIPAIKQQILQYAQSDQSALALLQSPANEKKYASLEEYKSDLLAQGILGWQFGDEHTVQE